MTPDNETDRAAQKALLNLCGGKNDDHDELDAQ